MERCNRVHQQVKAETAAIPPMEIIHQRESQSAAKIKRGLGSQRSQKLNQRLLKSTVDQGSPPTQENT